MVAPFHQMSCRPGSAGSSMSISRLLGLCWLVMLFAGSRCAAQPTGSDFGALRSGEVVVWIRLMLAGDAVCGESLCGAANRFRFRRLALRRGCRLDFYYPA